MIKKRLISGIMVIAMLGTVLCTNDDTVKADEITISNPRIEKTSVYDGYMDVEWDCLWFGSYPQTEITSDDGEIYELLISSPENEWENNDIVINGNQYRRMNGHQALFAYTEKKTGYYKWDDIDEYHYFKYEPIKWRVLEVEGDRAFLMADGALDTRMYSAREEGLVWANSDIRSWLNGYSAEFNREGADYTEDNFIDKAFTKKEQSAILLSEVVNNDNIEYGTEAGEDTEDKIYLLSEEELLNESYGFVPDEDNNDYARRLWDDLMSDYVIQKGASYSTRTTGWTEEMQMHAAMWWTRTPGISSDTVRIVYEWGILKRDSLPTFIGISIRPCIQLDLSKTSLYAYAGTITKDMEINEVEEPGLYEMVTLTLNEIPVASDITYGQTLADSELTGGKVISGGEEVEGEWKFIETSIAPTVNDSNETEYGIRFYPKDFKQYKKIDTTVTINVKKSEITPYYPNLGESFAEIVTNYIDGKTVSDVMLADYPGWQWADECKDMELVLDEFVEATVEYVGEDKDNYSNITATIKVKMNECDHKYTCTEVSEPTCQLPGVMVYSCNYCDTSYRVNNPRKPRLECDYQYNEEESQPLTCTTRGVTVYTCTMCKKSYSEVVRYTGHEFGCAEYKEPTCVEEGYNNYPCKKCDFVIENILPTLSHNYNIDAYSAPTCTTEGSVTKTCDFCNETVTETLDASGHKFSIVRVEATCTTDGSEVRTCTRGNCNHTETDILKAFGHNIQASWVEKQATCETDGVEIDYCTTCKKNLQRTIHKKGHNYKEIFSHASFGEDGYIIKKCSNNCGSNKITNIDRIISVELSATSYTYDGKVKTPNVIVKDSKGRVLIKNTDYTVVYPSGRKNKGKYKVLVKFKGNYTGEVSREFEIKAMPKPQKPKSTLITKLTAKKKGFVVKWRKITKDNTGYQLQYSTSRSFSKKTTKTITIGKTKTVSKTVSKLKAKKNYYVRVRCYYKVKYNNKVRTLYSSWTQTKKVKTKK
ncbi:MAG: hypothetical protein IJC76_09770 [Lachnospiraceae bacterium]|nr:hypothetical protein [Lachnospiraceae bacterium]